MDRAAPPAAHSWRGGSPTCSGRKPLAALLAPSVQNGAALARSDAMPEPVLALSAAIVGLVRALHFAGPLSDNPGTVPGAGDTACLAPAAACRHFLEVPQDYGHPACFAKMARLRSGTGRGRRLARGPSCSQENAKLFAQNAKISPGGLLTPVSASPYRLTWCYGARRPVSPPSVVGFPLVHRRWHRRRMTTGRAHSVPHPQGTSACSDWSPAARASGVLPGAGWSGVASPCFVIHNCGQSCG